MGMDPAAQAAVITSWAAVGWAALQTDTHRAVTRGGMLPPLLVDTRDLVPVETVQAWFGVAAALVRMRCPPAVVMDDRYPWQRREADRAYGAHLFLTSCSRWPAQAADVAAAAIHLEARRAATAGAPAAEAADALLLWLHNRWAASPVSAHAAAPAQAADVTTHSATTGAATDLRARRARVATQGCGAYCRKGCVSTAQSGHCQHICCAGWHVHAGYCRTTTRTRRLTVLPTDRLSPQEP
jgi:hypothetical protein